MPVTHPALARAAALGAAVGPVVVVQQRGGVRVDHQVDVAAVAAVGAVGPAQGFELLPVHRDAAVTSVARCGVQHHAVDEVGHS